MAELKISTIEDERAFEQYRVLRDKAREVMANGVYPNCVAALGAYSELILHLSDDMSSYGEYHQTATAQVAPHVEVIQKAMQTITTTMEMIEKAAPSTFGIEVSTDE